MNNLTEDETYMMLMGGRRKLFVNPELNEYALHCHSRYIRIMRDLDEKGSYWDFLIDDITRRIDIENKKNPSLIARLFRRKKKPIDISTRYETFSEWKARKEQEQ